MAVAKSKLDAPTIPLQIKNCRDCPLSKGRRRIVNFSVPESGARILFIGEGPGETEDYRGRPFVGRAGRKLRSMLHKAGIDDTEVAFGNIVRCRPPGNRNPKDDEAEACRKYLLEDVERIDPSVVVLLGNVALQYCHQKEGITKKRGNVFPAKLLNGRKALATFHPAAVLRDWSKEDVVIRDLQRAKQEARSPLIRPESTDYTVLETVADVEWLVKYLRRADEFVFDVETESLDYLTGDILCVNFSTKHGEGIVVPLRRGWTSKVIELPTKNKKKPKRVIEWDRQTRPYWPNKKAEQQVIALLREAFQDPGVPKVAQNGKFDIHWLRCQLGIDVRNFAFDDMLAYHLVHEERPHNLEHLRSLFTTMPQYDEDIKQYLPKKNSSYAMIPDEELWLYGAHDADCELRVKHEVRKALIEDYGGSEDPKKNAGLWLLQNHAMPLSRVYARVEEKGVFINQERLLELGAEYKKTITRELKTLRKLLGDRLLDKYDPSSPNQLRAMLYDDIGLDAEFLEVPLSKKTGEPSTNTRALMTIEEALKRPDIDQVIDIDGKDVDMLEVIECVLRLRRATKIKSSFLDGVKKKEGHGGLLQHIRIDGRIHPTFNIPGTENGRLSASNPNTTNIPAEGGIRSLFCAEYESPSAPHPLVDEFGEQAFIEADYKQIELRAMAYVSGDKGFQQALQTEDVHATVGSMLFGVAPEEVTTGMRIKAKTFNFGINYGRGPFSIAADFGIPVSEAEELMAQYLNRFPGIAKYQKRQKACLDRGEATHSIFGRKRRPGDILGMKKFMDRREWRKLYASMHRQFIAMVIAGSASDTVSQATIAIADYDGIRWGEMVEVHETLMKHYKCKPFDLPAIVLHEDLHTDMILSCHDALMFEGPAKYAEQAAELIEKTMVDVPKFMLGWDLPVDVVIGPYWGFKKDLVGRRGMDSGTGWRTLRASSKGAAGPRAKIEGSDSKASTTQQKNAYREKVRASVL